MATRESSGTRRRRFGVTLWLGAMICLVAAGAFFLMRRDTVSRASLALDRKLAQLRNEGAPLTAADIGKLMPDPDAEHDAREILRSAMSWSAGSRLTTNIPVGGPWPKRTVRIRSEAMDELATYLTNSDVLLSAIPEEFDGVRFSMGWTNGFANMWPVPFVQVRQLAQTLTIKAFYEGEKQDAERAVDALHKGFGLARALPGDSIMLTMIRAAVCGLMYEAAEQVLNRAALTEAQLAKLQKDIHPDLADDFAHPYLVARALSMDSFNSARLAQSTNGADRMSETLSRWVRGQWRPPYRDEDYLLFLNVMDERLATRSLPGLARLKHSEELDTHYATNLHSTIARMATTPWSKAMRVALEVRAKLVNMEVALALERYRLAHAGELPGSLSALVPEYLPAVPHDPLDEQPLRFKKLPRGYVIYSVGADGVDNGGKERANSNATNRYDVTFTVER